MTTWSPADVALVQQHLASMSVHPLFSQADRLAKFLNYIVEAELNGDTSRLNQNAIAIDVFERGADFDPSTDSIVRVEAGRLRAKLREYYDTVENGDGIRVELPRGGYVPEIIISANSSSSAATGPELIKPITPSSRFSKAVITIGVVLGIAIASYMLLSKRVDEPATTSATIPSLQETVKTDEPVSVVLNETPSIAVLPFVNMSDDPEQEYFSDGIAEEILNALSQLPDLRVAARTSSFYFKGEKIDLQTITDKLKVNHVLEGSVRKSGNRLRITAKLIKTDNGFQLWSETYDRELTDIFAIEDEIAKAVVKKLEVTLASIAPTEHLVKIGTTDLNAYNWFLRGKDQIIDGTPESLELAVQYFHKAIEIDPKYADAYGYLAFSQTKKNIFIGYGDLAAHVKEAYENALALDPGQSAALVAKAYHTLRTEWDWQKMYTLLQAAKSTGTFNDAWLSMYTEHYLWPLGRVDRAIQLLQEVERHDPLNVEAKYQQGWFFGMSGRPEKGIVKLKEALDLTPNRLQTLIAMAVLYLYSDDLESAETALIRLKPINNRAVLPFISTISIELTVARGELNLARNELEKLIQLVDSDKNVSPEFWPNLALDAVALDDVDLAIGLFQRTFEEQTNSAHWLRSWLTLTPAFKPTGSKLMAHPDFQALLKKMNLDDASITAMENKLGSDEK